MVFKIKRMKKSKTVGTIANKKKFVRKVNVNRIRKVKQT